MLVKLYAIISMNVEIHLAASLVLTTDNEMFPYTDCGFHLPRTVVFVVDHSKHAIPSADASCHPSLIGCSQEASDGLSRRDTAPCTKYMLKL
jgi:hypothetical protein